MLAARVLDDLDLSLELMIQRMIGILLIEISAFHMFAWAEELLSDRDLVAGDGCRGAPGVVHPPGRGAARRVPRHHAHGDA